jgi:threonine/homoserine/homoserine lactone efflux protein
VTRWQRFLRRRYPKGELDSVERSESPVDLGVSGAWIGKEHRRQHFREGRRKKKKVGLRLLGTCRLSGSRPCLFFFFFFFFFFLRKVIVGDRQFRVASLTGLEQLTTLLTGVVLGLSIAGPPGPVNATAAYEVGKGSWLSGWLVELGATTADGIFFFLTYFGLIKIIAGGKLGQTLFLIGGLILLFMAYSTIRHASKAALSRKPSGIRSPYLLGLSVAVTNPYQVAWWVTVGVGMVSTFGLGIVVGLFTGILGWTLIYTTALSIGLSRYQEAYPYVIYASGLILGAFGIWFLITAVSTLLI